MKQRLFLILLVCAVHVFPQTPALTKTHEYKTRFLEKGVDACYLIGADPKDSTIYMFEYDDNFDGCFISFYGKRKYKRLMKHPVNSWSDVRNGIWVKDHKKLVRFEKDEVKEEYAFNVRSFSPCSSGGCLAILENRLVYLNQNKLYELKNPILFDAGSRGNRILPGPEDQFYLISDNRLVFLCNPLHEKEPIEIRNLPPGNFKQLYPSKSIVFFKKGRQAGWIDHEKVTVIDTLRYPAFKDPESFKVDGNGRIFVLGNGGLLLFEKGCFSEYPCFESVSFGMVIADCIKGTDEIIYVQNGGIFRYSKEFKQFYQILQINWFSMYLTGALVRGDSLTVFSRSYPFFEIDLKKFPLTTPSVCFGSVAYDDKEFYQKNHVDIPYEKNFTISYKAIADVVQMPVSYQTRTLGREDTIWYATNSEIKQFPFLSPGDYSFQVRVRSQSGIWGSPSHMDFTILPPWYRSNWAYGGYSLAIVALFIGLFHWRTASLQREKDKLEQTIKQRTAEVLLEKEEADKQRQIAQKSAQIKQDFLSNMSHEIRTPLNAINGYTELSLQELLPEKVKKNLQAVKLSSLHLKKLADDILDISKLESGTMNFYFVNFDLIDLIEEIKTMLYFKVKERNNVISSAVEYNSTSFLFGDKDKFIQVMINLLDNAAKFTDNGKIDIQTEVKDAPGNQLMVTVKVSDTGIGIPAEKRSSIFESFVQADNSISRKYGGTGLGLSISKKIIELQGGQIDVESEENKGSTFTFRIPFLKGKELPKQSAPAIIYSKLYGLRVLAAEDDPVNQDLLQQLLWLWHVEVDFASTGEEVLKALKIKPYQLLLLDIHMPVLNGFEVVKQIRTEFPIGMKDIPIIALTADVLPATKERMICVGINDHVYKPVDASVLHNKIHRLLGLTASSLAGTPPADEWNILTQHFSLEYLTKNYGFDKKNILNSLNKSSCKLKEYNHALMGAFREKDFTELLFYTHRLKGIAGVLGIHSIREKIVSIDYLVETKQGDDQILTEIEAINQITEMAFSEITEVVNHISKN